MTRALIAVSLLSFACGPHVSDKDKKPFTPDGNNTSSNNTATNNVTSTNNVSVNNVSVNNVSANNTNPNNTSTNNTNPNNTNPNNTSTNNTNPNNTNPNNTTNNNTVPPEIVQKCAKACDMLWGSCVQNYCSLAPMANQTRQDILAGCLGTGGEAAELCTTRYQNEPGYRDIVDEYSTLTCTSDTVRRTRCELFGTDVCSCQEPDLGGPCTNDSQCFGGELNGYCIAQDTDGSNPGGQCLAGGCVFDENAAAGELFVGGSTLCGDQGACYVIDSGNSVCLPTCARNSECDRAVTGPNQSGYSCSIVGKLTDGSTLGICQSSCGDARPCNDGAVCSNLGACEFECFSNSDCPTDFNCSGMSAGGQMYCEWAG